MDTPRNPGLEAAAMVMCRLANPHIKTDQQLEDHWRQALSMRARAVYRMTALEVHSIIQRATEGEFLEAEIVQSTAQAADSEPF